MVRRNVVQQRDLGVVGLVRFTIRLYKFTDASVLKYFLKLFNNWQRFGLGGN